MGKSGTKRIGETIDCGLRLPPYAIGMVMIPTRGMAGEAHNSGARYGKGGETSLKW